MRFVVTIALLAAPAWAEGTIIVSPVYNQLVALPVPAGFAAGFENEADGSYILELIPAGETVDTWYQMITLTGGRGLTGKASVAQMASFLADGYQKACPGSFTAHQLAPPAIRGAGAVFAGYLGCGTAGPQAEAMVFVVLQGQSDMYTVQWAERGPAVPHPVEPDAAVWRSRVEALGLSRVCDIVAGEAAPYPSCTE